MRLPIPTAHGAVLVATFSLLVGCDLPPRPELKEVTSSSPLPTAIPVNDDDLETLEPPVALDEPTFETWDAYFINNQHTGYSHVTASPTDATMAGDVHFQLDHRVYQARGPDARVLQRLVMSSNETSDGRLLGFEGTMQIGLAATQFSGSMENSNLVVEVREGSNTVRSEIPWDYQFRGMFAVEQSLRAKPMIENGETRTLKMLISGRYQLATARLRCSGTAVVPLIDGSQQELIEINVEIEVQDAAPIYSAIWTDNQGNVVRTFSSSLNIIAYRTDQATATQVEQDDLVPVTIAINGKMERPEATKRVAYRVKTITSGDGQAAVQIKPGPGQYVRSTEVGATEILVSRQDEKPTGGFISDEPEPSVGDRRPNFFIDSNSDIVINFADAAIGSRKLNKLETAKELAGTASRMINRKPDRCTLSKASEVARIAEGGYAEAAVFLAALLRSQKIPSRIAVGLRFSPATESPRKPQQMVAHVWTLAHTGDQWIHLDPTTGDVAAADRILLATTNLSEGNENEAFEVVTQDIGRMEIDVLATKH